MREPQHIRTGDLVHVRRQRWRVVDVRAYDQCQLVALAGIEPGNRGLERRVLAPFEAVTALDRTASFQFVRPQRWRRACRALLADDAPAAGLRAARSARIDLLPHQLEPALAVLGGRGSRVLLADDVGLGKTIQAGLIIAELLARGMAERILIVTPAGLRDQWSAELFARFDITASIVDFRDVRHRVATLPAGVNPWSTVPVAIASIDYVKRADVLRSAMSCRWDVVVVDEAHGAAGDSDRRAAAAALGARAAYVFLLTATPHNGDVHAFNALCNTGAHADPLLVFRRTRSDVRLGGGRRVHRLHVRPSAEEVRMHALLDAFTRAVRAERRSADVWLPLAVLHKRALSSARSLERSVERRLAALSRATGGKVHQLDLPLADPGGEIDSSDDAPAWASDLGLADEARERRLLGALADAARAAGRHETKLGAITRLVNRIAESIVIFTEYRDTLLHLREAIDRPVLILHGGLPREERSAALDAFVSGGRHILLATDAAGEGLNLHHRCRVVINLELPWNPMRLEQRIGRVDRIGQRRTVHVFHLVARETNETRVLEQLKARIARAQLDIAAANPLEDDDRMMARLVIEGPAGDGLAAPRPTARTGDRTGADRVAARGEDLASHRDGRGARRARRDDREYREYLREEQRSQAGCIARRMQTDLHHGRLNMYLADEARTEAARLAATRRLSADKDDSILGSLEAAGTWIATARLRTTRVRLRSRVIALLRVDYEDGQGRTSHWTLVPLAVTVPRLRRRLSHAEVRRILRSIEAHLQGASSTASGREGLDIAAFARTLADVRVTRERAIAQVLLQNSRSDLQPGLFDRRAEHADLIGRAGIDDAAADQAGRLAACERAAVITARTPRLVLVLLP